MTVFLFKKFFLILPWHFPAIFLLANFKVAASRLRQLTAFYNYCLLTNHSFHSLKIFFLFLFLALCLLVFCIMFIKNCTSLSQSDSGFFSRILLNPTQHAKCDYHKSLQLIANEIQEFCNRLNS